jgi:hypothetical protein
MVYMEAISIFNQLINESRKLSRLTTGATVAFCVISCVVWIIFGIQAIRDGGIIAGVYLLAIAIALLGIACRCIWDQVKPSPKTKS